ncbi:MAG: class I SAM-dependent methyltransferase [Rhodospirillales bacterium]|nr:class I SAM-dependent methyltransferase [Rhodospirillales bacterium]
MSQPPKGSIGNIFHENNDGRIEFVGDFEGCYQNENDPWGQCGKDDSMSQYYHSSRERILNTLKGLGTVTVLEIGSGLGVVTNLMLQLPNVKRAIGIDISPTAVKKAQKQYPQCEFHVGNILEADGLPPIDNVDVVIQNQIFWYIMPSFENALLNCKKFLKQDGYLLLVQAFFQNGTQRYGKEYFDGFEDIVRLFSQSQYLQMDFISASLTRGEGSHYDDGQLFLKNSNEENEK